MTEKNALPTKLLWVDLEMTGLDPETDVILEVAAQVTDFELRPLATYEALVAHPHELVTELLDRNPWYQDYPENRELFLEKVTSGLPPDTIEQQLITLIESHFGGEPAILAGNSIYNDRGFIKRWWPTLYTKLHYRMLDVSAWKVWMQGAYGVEFEKHEAHRAQGDIQESIGELRYYLDYFKNSDHSK